MVSPRKLVQHDEGAPNVTVVTSLSALFKEAQAEDTSIEPIKGPEECSENEEPSIHINEYSQNNKKTSVDTKECSNDTNECSFESDILNEYSLDLPVVRRSMKHTRLNEDFRGKRSESVKGTEINRIKLLLHQGCGIRKRFLKNCSIKDMEVKSSKSCGPIPINLPSKKTETDHLIKHQSLEQVSLKPRNFVFEPKTMLVNSTTAKTTTNKDDFGSASKSWPFKILNEDTEESKRAFQTGQRNRDLFHRVTDSTKNDIWNTNCNRFKENSSVGCWVSSTFLKASRHVSIQHQPQTKNKTTSTTSLNKKVYLERKLSGSTKKLSNNCIEISRNYPSEIVLKLTSKEKAFGIKSTNQERAFGDWNAAHIQPSETKYFGSRMKSNKGKGKKRSTFTQCFSFKKEKGYDKEELEND